MKKCILVSALLVMPFTVKAQISGTVCDESRKPVGFANVIVLDADTAFVSGEITDENGTFKFKNKIPKAKFLKLSAVGYETDTVAINPGADGDVGTLTLFSKNVSLEGITVKGHRPTQRLSKDGIITQVKGSELETVGNAMDVMGLLPGVRREENEVTVFGKGNPEIYVNGRRLADNNELLRLSSKEIENVEVINNPGSKYGAEVKSVILVSTVKKQGDGWSGAAQAVTKAAHSWSPSGNADFNYRKNGIDIFGSFAFDYSNLYQKQRNRTYMEAGRSFYRLNSGITIRPTMANYVANGGFNWQINPKHVLGARYEFKATPYSRSKWTTDESVTKDEKPVDVIKYKTRYKRYNSPLNSLNMYYIGKFNRFTLTMNNDYYSNRNRVEQDIDESSLAGESAVNSLNRIKSSMFASKGVLEYAFGKGTAEWGYEYTLTDRTDRYFYYGDLLPDADDNIKEWSIAGFGNVRIPLGALEVAGGLRYEHTVSDYYKGGEFVPGQSRKYDRLFPNVSIAMPVKDVNLTLSYTAKTVRPHYSQLSSNIQYDDRFTYEKGNPLLQPELNHDVTLEGMYKWIYVALSYQYVKDAIVNIVEPYGGENPVNLMTCKNLDNMSRYSALLSLSPKISRWSPRLQLVLMGQELEQQAFGKRRFDNPLLFVDFYNSVSLGKGFVATGDVICHTLGDMDMVTLKPSWQVDFGVTKTCGNWYFQLKATDLFKTARNSMVTYGRSMKLDKWNYSDSQAVRLTVRYAFNITESKYKGSGAGQSEKERL